MDAQRDILLVAALKPEYEALVEIADRFSVKVRMIEFGLGRGGVLKQLSQSLKEQKPDFLVLFGTSGWLRNDKNYQAGQTYLIESCVYSPRRIEPDINFDFFPCWREHFKLAKEISYLSELPLSDVFTLDSPLLDNERREVLINVIEQMHAGEIDLVDMETWHVFEQARNLNIPMLVLRSLTDYAGNTAKKQFENNLENAMKNGQQACLKLVEAISKIDLQKDINE